MVCVVEVGTVECCESGVRGGGGQVVVHLSVSKALTF